MNYEALRCLSLDALPSTVARLDEFAKQKWVYRLHCDSARQYDEEVLIAALGYSLYRQAWDVDHEPGHTRMSRGDETIALAQLIQEMASPEFTQAK